MRLSHEIIQSIGVVVGILLGGTSLLIQLLPTPEKILIDPGEIVWTADSARFPLTEPLPQGNHTLVGPVIWKIVVTNDSGRTASLKSARASISDSKLGEYYTSGILGGIFYEDLKSTALPLTLESHESKAIYVRGFLPAWLTKDVQLNCAQPGITFRDFQKCALRKGLICLETS